MEFTRHSLTQKLSAACQWLQRTAILPYHATSTAEQLTVMQHKQSSPTNKKVPLSAKSAVGYPDNQLSSLGWIIFLLHWDKPCLTLGNPVRFR
jgi:hypothetical protein